MQESLHAATLAHCVWNNCKFHGPGSSNHTFACYAACSQSLTLQVLGIPKP